jgi:hypothetical protein
MVDIRAASMEEATRAPNGSGFLGSLGGPQFVVAQIFTILATILGVYLAGYVGFQRTLEYDRLSKAQQQANLLQSMQAELKDNTERLRAFVPAMEKTQEGEAIYGDWPRLRLFVWRASAENSALFEVPPQTLVAIQAFYEEMGDLLGDNAARDAFRRLTTSNIADRRTFTEQFDKLLRIAEGTLLPSLVQAAAASEMVVRSYADMAR